MAIIRYTENFIGISNTVWEEVRHPNERRKSLTKKEALSLIEAQGLELAYQGDDGEVWDTPDRAFWKKYHGINIKNT